jgi:type 1 glutamine amidotransferase
MKMKKICLFILLVAGLLIFPISLTNAAKYKALIITGQNNHNWKASNPVLKQLLDQTGLFTTDIVITPSKGGDMNLFNPDFSKYNLVVLDYNGDSWTEKTKAAFLTFVKKGGGIVVYHAADNSFPEWKEYNELIGLGGWGNRSEKDGPYVYFKKNELIVDKTAGPGGSHGKRHEYEVKIRNMDHPITKGLPVRWMHGADELYSQLRGPAQNMEILATAYADSALGGPASTNRDEPVLMTIKYGKGRIFHTALGHADAGGGPAMQCVGFIVTYQRGAEWAASGVVTQVVPFDFPTIARVVLRPDFKEITLDEDMERIGIYEIGKTTKYYIDLQNRIYRAAGNKDGLLKLEKLMVSVLKSKEATIEGKKLMLRELSWMGSDYCVSTIKDLSKTGELKDQAEFALARIKLVK